MTLGCIDVARTTKILILDCTVPSTAMWIQKVAVSSGRKTAMAMFSADVLVLSLGEASFQGYVICNTTLALFLGTPSHETTIGED